MGYRLAKQIVEVGGAQLKLRDQGRIRHMNEALRDEQNVLFEWKMPSTELGLELYFNDSDFPTSSGTVDCGSLYMRGLY
jgi:hypothetical protein